MSETTCRCGRPTRDDRSLCDGCVEQLDIALGDCAWLDEEIEVTMTRQRAASTQGGAPSATTPLPWHERAAEARRNLHALLVSWVRFCAEEDVRGCPPFAQVEDNVPSLSRWLLGATAGLALHDVGPDAYDEITDAVADVRRVVFWKRRNRIYLGPCAYGNDLGAALAEVIDCPGDVYADEGEPVGYCEECERGVTVVIRQGELDNDLHSRLLSAADIADWSIRMGLDATREEVRKRVLYWHRHKRVLPHAHEERGEVKVPLFRYGDVRTLLAREYGSRDTA